MREERKSRKKRRRERKERKREECRRDRVGKKRKIKTTSSPDSLKTNKHCNNNINKEKLPKQYICMKNLVEFRKIENRQFTKM